MRYKRATCMYLMSRGHNVLVDYVVADTEICRKFTLDPTESTPIHFVYHFGAPRIGRHRTVPWWPIAVLRLSMDWEGAMYPPAGINPPPPFSRLHVPSGENASWPQANQRRSNQVFSLLGPSIVCFYFQKGKMCACRGGSSS